MSHHRSASAGRLHVIARRVTLESAEIPTRSADGDIERLAMYAGQSVGLVGRREPAAEIVETIRRQALETLVRNSERAAACSPR
jgi:hypothetical protein